MENGATKKVKFTSNLLPLVMDFLELPYVSKAVWNQRKDNSDIDVN